MPVELRKRKAATEAPAAAPAPKRAGSSSSVKPKASKEATSGNVKTAGPPKVGQVIELDGFGGEIETHEGNQTTLKQLVEASKNGVALLAYPKASTPGCTTQVCLARDNFEQLTSTGLSIYGLSRDSPKANTTFKTKQELPYSLLCDKAGTLITAIGLKKAPAGTTRGVFVVGKDGKVLVAQAASPKDSVEIVKQLVGAGKVEADAKLETSKAEEEIEKEGKAPDEVKDDSVNGGDSAIKKVDSERAITAAEVADTAKTLDEEES